MALLIVERRHLAEADRLIAEGATRVSDFEARLKHDAQAHDSSSLTTLALLRSSLETLQAHRRQILIATADLKAGRV